MQEQPKLTAELTADSIELCKTVLSESSYNWFEMLEFLETKYGCNSAALIEEKFFSSIRSQKSNSNWFTTAKKHVKQLSTTLMAVKELQELSMG